MDFELAQHMLFVRNTDLPGFIGRLGMLLGEAKVNIATFNLGRETSGGEAICVVAVDEPVADAVLDRGEGLAACRAGAKAAVLRPCSASDLRSDIFCSQDSDLRSDIGRGLAPSVGSTPALADVIIRSIWRWKRAFSVASATDSSPGRRGFECAL